MKKIVFWQGGIMFADVNRTEPVPFFRSLAMRKECIVSECVGGKLRLLIAAAYANEATPHPSYTNLPPKNHYILRG